MHFDTNLDLIIDNIYLITFKNYYNNGYFNYKNSSMLDIYQFTMNFLYEYYMNFLYRLTRYRYILEYKNYTIYEFCKRYFNFTNKVKQIYLR